MNEGQLRFGGGGGGGGLTLVKQPLPMNPPPLGTDLFSGVVTPDGLHVYVGNDNNDSRPIYVFRTSDNKWLATVPAGNGPAFLAVTPDGTKVYAASYYSNDVTVIDTATNTVITTIVGFTQPQGIVITPDGASAYVADFGSNTVIHIDTATNTLVGAPIATGFLPQNIGVNPAGTKVYVTLTGDPTNVVQAISTATDTVVGAIPRVLVGPDSFDSPHGVAFKGTIAYVGCASFATVRRIDTTTDTLTGPAIVLTTNINTSLAITPANDKVYVPLNDGSVDVIDTVSNLVATNIVGVGGGNLNGTFANPVQLRMYVTDGAASVVQVINTATNLVVATVNSSVLPPEVVVGTFTELDVSGTKASDEGAGEAVLGLPVIFDDAGGTFTNIHSTRTQQAPSDNSKSQITNFGSKDSLWKPLSSGATGNASTIGGGDDNTAGPAGYETVAGGRGNTANGNSAAVGGGFNNRANADFATVAGGSNNLGSSVGVAIGGGQDNAVLGVCSTVPGGSACSIKADYAFATGRQAHAGGTAAFACGFQTSANGSHAHAEGENVSASGTASHAEGSHTNASGARTHAEGWFTHAINPSSHAEGDHTQAGGAASHAEGLQTHADGDSAHSQGMFAFAGQEGQHAHSCGPGTTSGFTTELGVSQQSVYTLAGGTPGVGVGESVELDFGLTGSLLQPDVLNDNMGWTIVVTAIARGMIGGVYKAQSFRQMFTLLTDAGVATLEASGAQEKIGSAAAASWTLVGSATLVPYNHFKLLFSTGATQSLVRITAKVEVVEINNSL